MSIGHPSVVRGERATVNETSITTSGGSVLLSRHFRVRPRLLTTEVESVPVHRTEVNQILTAPFAAEIREIQTDVCQGFSDALRPGRELLLCRTRRICWFVSQVGTP